MATDNTNVISRGAGFYGTCTAGSVTSSDVSYTNYCCTSDLCNSAQTKGINRILSITSVLFGVFLLCWRAPTFLVSCYLLWLTILFTFSLLLSPKKFHKHISSADPVCSHLSYSIRIKLHRLIKRTVKLSNQIWPNCWSANCYLYDRSKLSSFFKWMSLHAPKCTSESHTRTPM